MTTESSAAHGAAEFLQDCEFEIGSDASGWEPLDDHALIGRLRSLPELAVPLSSPHGIPLDEGRIVRARRPS